MKMDLIRRTLSAALVCLILLSLCPAALAAEPQTYSAEDGIVFSDISRLNPGESLQYDVTGPDGAKAVVGIEHVDMFARSGERTWRVWYTWLTNNVEFYMTVSNNKVTSVYDYSISLIGSTYEDASLSKTSTYGKLTFTLKSLGGLTSATCWLKGTVTGENDEIDVTWQM